jgi:hypothetical protein
MGGTTSIPVIPVQELAGATSEFFKKGATDTAQLIIAATKEITAETKLIVVSETIMQKYSANFISQGDASVNGKIAR